MVLCSLSSVVNDFLYYELSFLSSVMLRIVSCSWSQPPPNHFHEVFFVNRLCHNSLRNEIKFNTVSVMLGLINRSYSGSQHPRSRSSFFNLNSPQYIKSSSRKTFTIKHSFMVVKFFSRGAMCLLVEKHCMKQMDKLREP